MSIATVISAEIDPLRSDGEAFAAKLKTAGVPMNFKLYEGVTHEFFGLAGIVNEAVEAVAHTAGDLRKAFKNEKNVVEKLMSKVGAA